jgi:thioredoxin reductase (NADPH)
MQAPPPYSELPEPIKAEEVPVAPLHERSREVIIVGGGIAGLSAAIYLARALRDVLVIDAGESLAMWEPEVQNYLGFPDCIDGRELLKRGRAQAERYGASFAKEEIDQITVQAHGFLLVGKKAQFICQRLLLASDCFWPREFIIFHRKFPV